MTPVTGARRMLGWACLLVFVYFALQYLMSAFYSAWVAAGPPNPYPVGWARRAMAHASFSLAAMFLGTGAFRSIRRYPSIGRAAVALLAAGFLFAAAPYVGRFMLIDDCLDQGGHWNGAAIECEK